MSYISNNSKLYLLRLDGNSNIKWISYLSNLKAMRYFNLNSCNNIKDISSIKLIISACALSNVSASYSLDLIDASTTSLDLSNQTMGLTTFESLKNCTNLYRLNLSNLKLKDSNENIITDANVINTKINEVLSKLTKMQYLKLYGIAGLTKLDFVGSGKETLLVILDLRGTGITDLSNLNTYGTRIRTLTINNKDINMSNIDTLLRRFSASRMGWWYFRLESWKWWRIATLFSRIVGKNCY